MKILFALLAALVMVPQVYAELYHFEEYQVGIHLESGAQETIATVVNDGTDPIDSLEFLFGNRPSSVYAVIWPDSQLLTEVVRLEGGYRTVVYFPPVQPGENITVELSFISDRPVEALGDDKAFRLTYTAPARIDRYSLTITLPRGSSVVKENGAAVVSPEAGLSTDGESIIVFWETPLEPNESFTAIAVFNEESDLFPLLILAVLVPLIYLAARIAMRKRERTKIVALALDEDEKRVFEVVQKYPKGCLQTDVIRETGYSKATVSKIVRRLELKGLMEKKPHGRTNVLRISVK